MGTRDHVTESSPERATPEQMTGRLMESEHRGRYLWAAQLAAGRTVLDAGCGTGYGTEILAAAGALNTVGVDIAQDAIDYASASSARPAPAFKLGSLHELPFADETFDLVVCFEVIEHVDNQTRAIAEISRVLKPGGVLVMSSPNRDVYPPGNPHHTHEFTPTELERVLKNVFASVDLYRQSPWLGAAIFDDEQSRAKGPASELLLRTVKTAAVEPGREVFTIAIASTAELPLPAALTLLGEPFEVRWWEEQLERAEGELARERSARIRAQEECDDAHRLHGDALLTVESELASAYNEVATLRSSEADLKQWAIEQINERDEQLRLSDLSRSDLGRRLQRAEKVIGGMSGSISWRVTSPLRAAKRILH